MNVPRGCQTALTAYISDELRERLEAAINALAPYEPTMSAVIRRGLELAIEELEKK